MWESVYMTTPEKSKTGRAARPTDEESVKRRAELDAWQRGITDQVIENILHYRDARGLSNDQLRERLSALGWDLTKDSLASVLSGSTKRKTMPVSDVLLFASALNVPPIALVFPIHTNAEVNLMPVKREGADPVSASVAARWMSGTYGDVPVPISFDEDFDVLDEYYEVADMVSRIQEYEDDMHRFRDINATLIEGTLGLDETKLLVEQAKGLLVGLAEFRYFIRIRNADLKLSDLPAQLFFLDTKDFVTPSLPLIGYNTVLELESARELNKQAQSNGFSKAMQVGQ
jgi:hypothetical protein